MELNRLSDIFQSRLRLMIISALLSGNKTFNELKEITEATDGNISVQISKLETVEYVSVIKGYVGKKPQTTVAITPKGRADFKEYIDMLNKILEESENGSL